jgi:hypothetical protein
MTARRVFPPLLLLFAVAAAPVSAQDTTQVRRDSVAVPDTVVAVTVAPADSVVADTLPRGQIGAMGAFWRSFLIPGWGQAALGRRTAAGIFVAVEGATLAMTVKTMREVSYLKSIGSARQDDKEQEREDWLVLLAFNHLVSGLEAYVSAQLWDFPGDLSVRRIPGGAAAEVSIPVRVR